LVPLIGLRLFEVQQTPSALVRTKLLLKKKAGVESSFLNKKNIFMIAAAGLENPRSFS
jgi:hypothetical protein